MLKDTLPSFHSYSIIASSLRMCVFRAMLKAIVGTLFMILSILHQQGETLIFNFDETIAVGCSKLTHPTVVN
ncbi:unnamed protein product [Lathyrus sativus]|nr:unnamed protein product [Lathyrus sativus]